jgi:RAB protein geranylgeranyltransferase component A
MVESSNSCKDPSAYTKAELQTIASDLMEKLEIRDRTYHLKTYPKCFVASDLVKLLMSSGVSKFVYNFESWLRMSRERLNSGRGW